MRSLWRILALRWLGGDGSDALTADSAILDGLPYGGNWGHLKSSDDAVLRHQDGVSTSPWRVMSVRQSQLLPRFAATTARGSSSRTLCRPIRATALVTELVSAAATAARLPMNWPPSAD